MNAENSTEGSTHGRGTEVSAARGLGHEQGSRVKEAAPPEPKFLLYPENINFS